MNIQNHKQLSYAKLARSIIPASYNDKKILFTILYSLCVALSLISFIFGFDVLIKANFFLGMFAIIILCTRIRREYVPIYIFVGFLAASFFVSSVFVGRTGWRSVQPYIFIVSSFGAALILLRGYVYSWSGYIVFYSLAVFFLSFMLHGVEGDTVLQYCSRNGISMVMLVVCISLYIVLSLENKKIDLKPAILNLIISIWAIGRSGIIASFVLVLGLLLVRFRPAKKYIYIMIISLFIGSLYFYDLIMLASQYSFFVTSSEHYLANSTTDVADVARWIFWSNYFNNLDISRVIFGVNVVEDPWPQGEINDYNYHNSFINLHLQTGLMGLITLVLIIFALLKFYRTNKVFFFLLLTIIFRASTDLFIFFGRFDFIPYFFIFYFLKSTPFRVPHINRLFAGTKEPIGQCFSRV